MLPHSERMTTHEKDGVVYYTFPAFDALPFVRHGFSTRLGGVSEGIYASMNLSFTRGDDPACVRENFHRFCNAAGMDVGQVVVSAQEHHVNIRNATAADRGRGVDRERGYVDIDGLLTDEPGVVLCTQYADCVPLLFVDPVRRVVGTSHAGWRGTVARIGAVTVERMAADYGCRREDILAAVAPSIGPCCFEVDEPVFAAFSQAFAWDGFRTAAEADGLETGCYEAAGGGKYRLNLWEINRRILREAGVPAGNITLTDLCTRCHPELFWSHRAAGPQRGSLAAFIALSE